MYAKPRLIDYVVAKAHDNNKAWLREYLENNYEDIMHSIAEGNVLKHGFRGLEVEEAIKALYGDISL